MDKYHKIQREIHDNYIVPLTKKCIRLHLEEQERQLYAENARLREALKNIGGIEATWEPCPYDADRVAFMTAQALAEEALYPYGSYLEQLSLKEGNDEGLSLIHI